MLRSSTGNCGLLRSALLISTVLASGLAAPALAQSTTPTPLPYGWEDKNGVEMATGTVETSDTFLSIGANEGTLSFGMETTKGVWGNNTYTGKIVVVTAGATITATVDFGGNSESFTVTGSSYVSKKAEGSTLALSGSLYTYTTSDGTTITFDTALWPTAGTQNALPTTIKSPAGTETKIHRKAGVSRIQSVTNNRGYQLKYGYPNATSTNISDVKAINNAVDYCDPVADACSGLTQSWPTVTIARTATTVSVTDPESRLTQLTMDGGGKLTNKRLPGRATDNIMVTYFSTATSLSVNSVTKDGVLYNYAYSATPVSPYVQPGVPQVYFLDTIATGPLGMSHKSRRISATDQMGILTDGLNRVTNYGYDSNQRVTNIVGAKERGSRSYDARGNTITSKYVDSSVASAPTQTFSYLASCTNPKICNKPLASTDPMGRVTDFTYDAATGQILTITSPAAAAGGVRRKTIYVYAPMQAYIKNSAGSVVSSGQEISVLASSSTCQTLPSCAGTADEVLMLYSYGPQSAGTGNNLLPVSVTVKAGDNSLSATTSFIYDFIGNVSSADGPLPGPDDTSYFRYNKVRELVGEIGPDPDGSGPRPRVAKRTSYNPDGTVAQVEIGTVNGVSDADWSAFVSSQQSVNSYDAYGRLTKNAISAGGTAIAVTQYSYDSVGRLECTAQRMDPAQWNSQTAACTAQTTGAFGPDRITKNTYDIADQLIKVQTAFGTVDVADEMTFTYGSFNGRVEALTDANSNKTTYSYDAYHRLSTVAYPLPATPNASSTTDYEQLTYDANGNVTQRRLRDGKVHLFTYDNLNRVTLRDVPTGVYYETDKTMAYDLLGRVTLVGDGTGGYNAYSYDALGRKVSETANNWEYFGTIASEYDLAGRRTKLTHPDGFFVTYEYDATGAMTTVRENGAATGLGVLATYTYDGLGRRTTLTRGNGAVTRYEYDPLSRLTGLQHDFVGTPSDVTYGRVDTTGSAITYTPSGQISTFSRDNDSYKWNGHFNVNRLYGTNGLNQLIATTPGAGQTSVANLGYDGRGNLNLSGTTSYVYTTENRLATAGPQSLAYDSVDRLLFVGGVAVFRYDGTDLIQERSPSNGLARRYVHGPGTDEPLVWYEGAGTTDRRWLHADERGSIIAVSNSVGSVIAINSYDEYGIPASTNQGRFQYTGQTWLPEIGLYYYKARMYSPTLGRFMQTDLMGYAYGMNWYNYVGADPVNKTDPSGLADADIVVIGRRPMPNPSVINCYNGGCDRSRSADNGGFDGNSRIGYGNTYGYGQQAVYAGRWSPPQRGNKMSIVDKLLDHYKNGKGKPYCLSEWDFSDIMSNYRSIGNASVAHRDGSGNRVTTVSFYGTPLANAYGNGSIIQSPQGGMVGFHDDYDFNASSHRGIFSEAATAYGRSIEGIPFSIDFNNRSCGGAD
jgi:RHS repeat-associated protein